MTVWPGSYLKALRRQLVFSSSRMASNRAGNVGVDVTAFLSGFPEHDCPFSAARSKLSLGVRSMADIKSDEWEVNQLLNCKLIAQGPLRGIV